MSVRVDWSEDSGRCAVITLDRPDKRNAVDMTTLRSLLAAQAEVLERRCRVVLLRGEGAAFCSGADLDGVELGEFTDTLARVLQGFVDLPSLTLVLIDGPALGAGMQLAAACDLRLATAGSPIGVPAVKLGLAVDTWTVARIGREAGWGVARRILLTGAAVPAETLAGGFVHRLVEPGRAEDEALAWARDLCSVAPLSVAAHKAAFAAVEAADAQVLLARAEEARLAAWASEDAAEGRRAFREKRPPQFGGR